MTHEEMIAVIAAAKEGKLVQVRYGGRDGGRGEWAIYSGNSFNFVEYDYRIKPEPPKPREWWINGYTGAFYGPYSSKEAADSHATPERTECIRVREVIEGK